MSCNFCTIDGYVVTVYQCLYMADVVVISLWLMLLPLFDVGRCYCHVLSDVIAILWLMLLLLLMLADVIAMFG